MAQASDASDPMNSPTHHISDSRWDDALHCSYMSPEQARCSRVDKRADIGAFGVVLTRC